MSIGGVVFIVDRLTERECFQRGLGGLPAGSKPLVESVVRGTPCFVFNTGTRLLHGVFEASSAAGGMHLDRDAFGGRFPAQVRFRERWPSPPLRLDEVRHCLSFERGGGKFNLRLIASQAALLCDCFREAVGRVRSHGAGAGTAETCGSAPRSRGEDRRERSSRSPQLRRVWLEPEEDRSAAAAPTLRVVTLSDAGRSGARERQQRAPARDASPHADPTSRKRDHAPVDLREELRAAKRAASSEGGEAPPAAALAPDHGVLQAQQVVVQQQPSDQAREPPARLVLHTSPLAVRYERGLAAPQQHQQQQPTVAAEPVLSAEPPPPRRAAPAAAAPPAALPAALEEEDFVPLPPASPPASPAVLSGSVRPLALLGRAAADAAAPAPAHLPAFLAAALKCHQT